MVPTDDLDCWPWYPQYNWIYNKLKIASSQAMSCGPHGVVPPSFPVFSKPVINLKGMGLGSRVIATPAEMETHSTPGHFWMPFLEGPHVSTDCAIVNGQVQWIRHATGIPWDDGMFKYWTLHAEALPALGGYITTWVSQNMANYTGMMNFETIGGKIIEAHLRFADQWCDMNGEGWIDALVRLYAKGIWQHADDHRQVGYSIPLFAKHNNNFKHPTPDQQTRIRSLPEVSSLTPSMKTKIRAITPCRPVVSVWGSSMHGIWKQVLPPSMSWQNASPKPPCFAPETSILRAGGDPNFSGHCRPRESCAESGVTPVPK